jgi:hypothetical protein
MGTPAIAGEQARLKKSLTAVETSLYRIALPSLISESGAAAARRGNRGGGPGHCMKLVDQKKQLF